MVYWRYFRERGTQSRRNSCVARSRFFFFKQETAYEIGHVTGVQTCALPISSSPVGAIQVLVATVKGLNAFWVGTLIPLGLKIEPSGFLNGSGVNGTAASDASKKERVYLKSDRKSVV